MDAWPLLALLLATGLAMETAMPIYFKFALVAVLVALAWRPQALWGQEESLLPERVAFMSADGHTELVGYVYRPPAIPGARVPAVVMMHGRAGAYSERAHGVYDASTLSLRHKAWGREWAEAGYVAILVDGFGPRGYAQTSGDGATRQAPKQTKPLPEGYVPDLAKPDRDNKDVQANAQWLADREKIRNTVLSYSHLFDERNFEEWNAGF
jgi:hypothetical protein